MKKLGIAAAVSAVLAGSAAMAPAWAEEEVNFDEVEINVSQLADGYYELAASGGNIMWAGNIVISVGDDGVLMIDDQFSELTGKIKAAIATVTDEPVKFIINTHSHGDHTSGNADWARMGAVIVSHDNLYRSLAARSVGEKASFDPAGLPKVTYDSALTFHWNGDTVSLYHPVNAHTDGDSVIYFAKGNIVHGGDIWRTVSYPRASARGGGSMQGTIETLDYILSISDDNTKIIPGHGEVTSKAELADAVAMLKTVYGRVEEAKAAGKSLEEVKAMKPTREFDARWNSEDVPADDFVESLYTQIEIE